MSDDLKLPRTLRLRARANLPVAVEVVLHVDRTFTCVLGDAYAERPAELQAAWLCLAALHARLVLDGKLVCHHIGEE